MVLGSYRGMFYGEATMWLNQQIVIIREEESSTYLEVLMSPVERHFNGSSCKIEMMWRGESLIYINSVTHMSDGHEWTL